MPLLRRARRGGSARLIGGRLRRRRRCARHHYISVRFFFHGTWVGRYTVRRTPFVRAADPVSDNTSATDNRWVSPYRTIERFPPSRRHTVVVLERRVRCFVARRRNTAFGRRIPVVHHPSLLAVTSRPSPDACSRRPDDTTSTPLPVRR